MTANPFPARSEADWRKAAAAALKGAPLDKLTSVTADGLKLGPLHEGVVGPRAFRGEAGPWKALTRLDHPSAADFNAQALEDLENGADGLEIVFAGSAGGYGFGLAHADAPTLHRAFEGVRFDAGLRFALDVGAAAQAVAFASFLERVRPDEGAPIDVSFGVDPLGAQARAGAASPDDAALQAVVADLAARGFAGPFVVADSRPVHDAGGTPAQELAFALAAGLSYLRRLERPDAIAFRLAADADQFATLAKFRAMRLLWARLEQACGLAPKPIRLQAVSSWRMMTAIEPYINVMRAGLAAFAAGLGGADSVTLLPFTQALGLPDSFARRLARNTQLIELKESRLGFVADPAAGAGGFETLTAGLAEKAWTLFQGYEAAGGLSAALTKGLVQQEVKAAAEALRRDVGRAKAPITGVSTHPHLDADRIAVLPDTPAPPPPAAEGALVALRLSEPFERLRASEGGFKVFLAAIGPLSAHTRRLGFARDFFVAGGLPTLAGAGAEAAEALVAEYAASGAALACLCGTDDAYAAQAEPFAAALKAAGARVWLAGRPGDKEAAWRAAGIEGFIFAGADMAATLERARNAS